MKLKQGYTLIEVLIVLSIFGILFGVGFAGFRDFSRRQVIVDSAKSVQGDLRLAQQMALSGQKPTDSRCTGTNRLNGYFFNILTSTRYEIRANCSGGAASNPTKDATLPAGISFASPFPSPNPILFKVLGEGTNLNSSNTEIIVLQTTTRTGTRIEISSGGQIEVLGTEVFGPGSSPGSTPTATPDDKSSTPGPTAGPTATPGGK